MRKKEKYIENFKSKIADYLNINPENVYLFWKGRVALYAILRAIGIKENDEVILPAFTCVVAVNPIIYPGAKPIYVDIDPKTYTIDANKIESKITSKTKAILAQNTFGLSCDLDKIIEIAKRYNIFVIEDCAHGFGGFYKSKPNGTVSDVAFFSTQWNKPFSTGIGGIAITKNDIIAKKLYELEKKALKPTLKEEQILRSLLFFRNKLLNYNTYWYAIKIYRLLSKWNLILDSSQGYEIEKPIEPKDFFKSFSTVQAKEGLKYFEKENGKYKIDYILEHRKKIAQHYKKFLSDLGFSTSTEPEYANHTNLKFPLLVKNREKFFYLAQKERIELGDWFLSPIHPVIKNFEYWYYNYGENPIAECAARHIVNLPTHFDVDENYLEKIFKFLKRQKDEIIGSTVEQKFRG